MALYTRRISVEALLPIQPSVSPRTLRKLAALATVPAIEAVLYPVDGEEKYLIADGHHRSYRNFQRGEDMIDARVALDDSGIIDLQSPAFTGSHCLAEAYGRYESWRLNLETAGVVSVPTLHVREIFSNPIATAHQP
jgi:hypothetical protein